MTVEGTLKTAFPPGIRIADPSRASTAVSGHFRLTGGNTEALRADTLADLVTVGRV